jgi:hypothetical protein
MDTVNFVAIGLGCEQGLIKSLFNMKDVTVPLPGEVFWIEQIVARHWERV